MFLGPRIQQGHQDKGPTFVVLTIHRKKKRKERLTCGNKCYRKAKQATTEAAIHHVSLDMYLMWVLRHKAVLLISINRHYVWQCDLLEPHKPKICHFQTDT